MAEKSVRHFFRAALVGGLWLAAGPARAEEPSAEPATVRKIKDRLHFQVPPDWPIESRGGITAPIPIEEYLGRKFKAIEIQLQSLEQRQGGFDIRMRVLEEEARKQRQELRSMEQPPAPEAAR